MNMTFRWFGGVFQFFTHDNDGPGLIRVQAQDNAMLWGAAPVRPFTLCELLIQNSLPPRYDSSILEQPVE